LRQEVVRALAGRFDRAIVQLEGRRGRRPLLRRLARMASRRLETSRYELFDQLSIPPATYLEHLARSRIGVSVPGRGFDTYRYWETPACGALLVSMRPTIRIHDDFEDGRNAVHIDAVDDLVPIIEELLRDPQRVARMAAAGREHLLAHHTDVKRAQRVLAVLEEQVG
jgi:hypothetical protein